MLPKKVVVPTRFLDSGSDLAVGSNSHSSANSAILVKVANWLRCRKLANVSPYRVWLIQGLKSAAAPKYCRTPVALLITPAINQEQAIAAVTCFKDIDFVAASNKVVRMQNHENKRGTVAGEGPGAKGLIQGSVPNKSMAVLFILSLGYNRLVAVFESTYFICTQNKQFDLNLRSSHKQ